MSGRHIVAGVTSVLLDPDVFRARWTERGVPPHNKGFAELARVVAWHRQQALICGANRHWFGQEWHLTRLLETNEDGELHQERADARAELARWQDANEDFDLAAAAGFGSPEFGYHRALIKLAMRDDAAYRQVCETLLQATDSSAEASAKMLVLWSCAIAPDSGVDPVRLVALMNELLTSAPSEAGIQTTAGLVFLRALQPETAIAHLRAEVSKRTGESLPVEWLLLSMAYQDQGDPAEAKKWFEKAGDFLSRELDPNMQGTFGALLRWPERIEWQMLRDQAAAKLQVK